MDKDLSNHGAVSYGNGLSGQKRDLPDVDLSDHGAISYGNGLSGQKRDLSDVDLSDHGAISYGNGLSGQKRDLPDVDLSDHGAVSYGNGLSGQKRDLSDVDLSDHGAISYGNGLSGYSRDLPDVDLSDHGAVSYEPKSVTWGTNDEEIVKQMNILMHSSYSSTINQVIPLLNASSLAKVVDYRYCQTANVLDDGKYGLSKDDKEKLGTNMFMDFIIIDSMISSNHNSLQPIFNPSLYAGSQQPTDAFGVLEKYQQDLDKANVQIPLINGSTGKQVVDETGKVVTAQDALNHIMSKKEMYQQQNSSGRKL